MTLPASPTLSPSGRRDPSPCPLSPVGRLLRPAASCPLAARCPGWCGPLGRCTGPLGPINNGGEFLPVTSLTSIHSAHCPSLPSLLHTYARAGLRPAGGLGRGGRVREVGAAQRQTKLHHLSGQQSAIPVMNCLISFFNAFIWNSSLR